MPRTCGSCGTGVGNPTAVEVLNRVHEYMAPIVDSGLPLQSIKPHRGYGLQPFLFDIAYIEDTEYLRLKDGIMNGNSFIDVKVDPTDCAVVWEEQGISTNKTEITEEVATGATTIKVKDPSVFGSLGEHHTVIVTVGSQTFTGRVESFDPVDGEITLKAGPAIALPAGSCIKKGTYNRPRDCTTAIDNSGYVAYNRGKYKSYFRKIEASISFDENTDCTLSSYTYADAIGLETSTLFLQTKKSEAVNELNQQLVNAIYHDLNFAKNSNPAFPGVSQTMGLNPQLDKVQDETGKVTYFDFAGDGENGCCVDGGECGDISRSIQTFMDWIDYLVKSGAYGNTIIAGANEQQLALLQRMLPYFEAESGHIVTREGDYTGSLFMGRKIVSLEIGMHTVEFRYAPEFDDYGIPYMLLMPEDTMMFVQKEYNGVEYEGGTWKAASNEGSDILPGMPIFRVVDHTPYTSNRIDPCAQYSIDAEIAIVWALTDKGAYLRMANFGSCLPESCWTCDANDSNNPGVGKTQVIGEA